MKKNIVAFSILIFAQTLLSTHSYAYTQKTLDECMEMKESSDLQSRCLDTVKEIVNRELQTWVNYHVLNLEEITSNTGRSSALNMFNRAQNDFFSFRKDECQWQYLVVSPEKNARITYKKCFILTTQNRITQLSSIQLATEQLNPEQ